MFRLFIFSVLTNALVATAFSLSSHHVTNSGAGLSSSKSTSLLRSIGRHQHHHHDKKCVDGSAAAAEFYEQPMTTTRREILARTAASLVVGASPVLCFLPQQSQAADKGNDEGMVSQSKLGSLLKRIPTFAIVDPRGVPYFVVGEDAKLTSYFFLSYGEAKRILDVANKSSDKAIKESRKEIKAKRGVVTKEDEEEIGTNPWKNARITSVTLDLAVSLASKGKLAGAYFRLAPSESDIEDALAADGSDDLPEGRVPLFYVEDMTISDGDEEISPLYFQKDQLIAEWKRQQNKNQSGEKNKDASPPNIKTTELFATLVEMVRPGGKDEELKTLQFVAPAESKAKAEKCRKGEKEPFRLGERLIVL